MKFSYLLIAAILWSAPAAYGDGLLPTTNWIRVWAAGTFVSASGDTIQQAGYNDGGRSDPAQQLSWSGNNFTESFTVKPADGTFIGTYTVSGTATGQEIVHLTARSSEKTINFDDQGRINDSLEVINELELQHIPSIASDTPDKIVSFDYPGPDVASKVLMAKQTVISTSYLPAGGTVVTTTAYTPTSLADAGARFENYYGVAASGDLAITAISLVQVEHNSTELPLIAGKKTLARVFIKSAATGAKPVNGVFAVLHGPSAPDAQTVSGTITAQPYDGPIPSTATPDFTEKTVDFILPDAWVKTPGDLTLTAEIVPPEGFQDSNPGNNQLQRTVTVIQPPQDPLSPSPPGVFRIGYFTIDNQPPGAAAPFTVDPGAGGSIGDLVQTMFPVGDGRVEVSRITKLTGMHKESLETDDDFDSLLKHQLRYLFAFEGAGYDQVVAIIPVWRNGRQIVGTSDPIWGGGAGKVVLVKDLSPNRSEHAQNVAHEIGHNLGLRHANLNAPALGCNVAAYDDCNPSFWPYTDPTIQFPGYNTAISFHVPNTFFDLMSYCNSNPDRMWISPDYYQLLITNDLAPSDAVCPSPSGVPNAVRPQAEPAATPKTHRQSLAAAAQDYLLVSGTASADGQSGKLSPVFHLTTRAVPPTSNPNGDYCLRFLGGSGVPGDYCFTMKFTDVENNSLTNASFSFLLAAPAGATGIALIHSAQPIASISGGAQPPSLSITSPNNGDNWSSTRNLTWTGSSSAPLTYLVDYSHDGGTTWTPLSLVMTDTTLSVDPGDLLGSPVFFRVQASDGFNTTTAQVGPIQLTQTPQIAASPASLDFRNGLPGIGVERDLMVSSTGSGPLQVTKVAFDNPAFKLISPTVPFTIFSGDAIRLQVTFTAPSAGPAQGNMTITSNAAATPSLVIPLTGTGIASVAPDASVSLASVDFGQVATGQTATQTVVLQNFGPGQMQVNSVSVTGAGFSLADGLAQTPFSMAIERVSIGVQFAPTQAGAQTGSLTIATSDPARASIVVTLRGTGTTTCSYTLAAGTPNPPSFSNAGGSGTATVTVGAGCSWTATSSDSTWLATTSTGSGNGTVNYTVAANTSTSSRTGTMTVNGQTLTVTQAAGITVTSGLGTTNLALNKPVTVSSKYPTYQGKVTTIADGAFAAAWYAYQGAPSYCSIVVDLGQTYSIGKIEVEPLQTFDYQIYGSTDGTNYSQISSQTWPVWISAPVSVAVNGSTSARYIKYEAHTPWNQYIGIGGFRVYEWLTAAPAALPASAYGSTNLAKGKSIQNAPGGYTSDPNNPPANVVDGNLSTAWFGTNATYAKNGSPYDFYFTAGMVLIDLGQSNKLGKIVITPAKAQAFGVYLTPDNTLNTPAFVFSSYQNMFATSNVSSDPQTFYIDGRVSARYVWLVAWNTTPGGTPVYPAISEIEVYGFNQ